MSPLFNPDRLIANRLRAVPHFHAHDFLITRVWADVTERVMDIKRTFDHTLVIGARGCNPALDALAAAQKIGPDITVMDYTTWPTPHAITPRPYDILSVTPGTYDLVISVFDLQTWTDVPTMLMQLRAALKPDGVCLIAFLGGETLYELKTAMTATEIALRGGLSPRIHPVIDIQQMAALMQRTGFALPVIDNTKIIVDYTKITTLLHDIRGMGEGNAMTTRDARPLNRTFWDHVEQHYNPDGNIFPATFDVIHAIGWAPHQSQQQPKPRGSGTVHLSTVLK